MAETTPNEASAKPRRRWLTPVLIASLALNLLVLGAVAGWAWRHGPGGPWRGPHGGAERILRLLPEEKRDAAAAIIARYKEGDAARDAEAKAAHDAVIQALTAEPFSRTALEQALTRAGSAELGRRMQPAMLAEIAETLTVGERKDLAGSIEKLMQRWGRRYGRGS